MRVLARNWWISPIQDKSEVRQLNARHWPNGRVWGTSTPGCLSSKPCSCSRLWGLLARCAAAKQRPCSISAPPRFAAPGTLARPQPTEPVQRRERMPRQPQWQEIGLATTGQNKTRARMKRGWQGHLSPPSPTVEKTSAGHLSPHLREAKAPDRRCLRQPNPDKDPSH